MSRFLVMPVLVAAMLLPAATSEAQEIVSSPVGTVLFSLPGDRLRVEEAGYTALKGIGFVAAPEIRIRPPFQSFGAAGDAVEMHAHWVATAFRVQAVTVPTAFRHRAGFDVALRTFILTGGDGRTATLVVAALKSHATTAIVEFISAGPQSPQAFRQLADFLDRCRLEHIQLLAGGTPPLTRPQADAALDVFYFMAGQLEGVQAMPSAAAKDHWAAGLAAAWSTLPPDSRTAIAAMPEIWAATVTQWAGLTPSDRQQVSHSYAQLDVIKALRADLAAARDRMNAAAATPAQPAPAQAARAAGTVDVSSEIANHASRNQAAISWSNQQFNATMTQMAAIGNMSGTRYTTRPR
jgi:hypothetical protein